MPDPGGRGTAGQAGRLSIQDLVAAIDTGAIDTVIVAICDMQGRLVGKRVAGWYARDHLVEHGGHFCTYLLGNDMEMNTPDGYPLMNWETGYGDYVARPDWATLRVLPWHQATALVLADAIDESTGEEVPVAPRSILTRQIARLRERGLEPRLAMELEYYLFDESYESARRKAYRDLERAGWYSEDYHILHGSRNEDVHGAIRRQMVAAGIPVESSKGEDGAGQHEINLHVADALEAADQAVLFKHGCKEIARLAGKAVTFMAKLDPGANGSSGHLHVSLADIGTGRNAFVGDGVAMSTVMEAFLAGALARLRELSILFAPNVNSYKRYAEGSWAPVTLLWSRDNRTVAFRIVGQGPSLRIECRLPGGDANPYLAMAALLAAGIDGIEHQRPLQPEFQGSGYAARDVPTVPRSLREAIDAWEASTFAAEAFGAVVHAHYLNAARVELAAYDAAVTDWELLRYFERG